MTLVIAHRGASADRPEQTRQAYEAALAQGADGVECDVRLTSDGAVVCMHDGTVDRTSNGTGAVHQLSLDDLRALDYGVEGADGHRRAGDLITLAELVDLTVVARRPVVLAIELKHPNPVGTAIEAAVLEVLAEAGWDPESSMLGSVTISLMSFNPESVQALAPVVSPRHLMMLTADFSVDDVVGEIGDVPDDERQAVADELAAAIAGGRELVENGTVGQVGPDLTWVRANPDRVRRWIDAGRLVRVWTVDDAADTEFCLALGVQQITTDSPAAVRALIDDIQSRERA